MIYLILAAILWGSSFPVIRFALGDISATLFLILRFLLAFLILVPRYRSFGDLRRLFRRDLILISIPNALSFILQYQAQEVTTASKAAVFVNSSPVFVPFLALALVGESVKRRQLLAIAVALVGVVMTSTSLEFSDFSALNRGDLLCIIVGLSWAVFIVFSGPVVRRYGPYEVSQTLYFWGVVFALPFLPLEPVRFAWSALPAVVYLAVFTTVVAYLFYLKGVRTTPSVTTSLVILIEVVVAFGISHFLLGESFTTIEGIGVLLVLGGVALVGR